MAMRGKSLGCAMAFAALVSVPGNVREGSLVGAFLGKLKPEQREAVLLPFDHDARTGWAYVPGRRPGVVLKDLSPAQKEAALEMFRGYLSEAGYRKVRAIQSDVEQALRELEGNPGRDPELYYVTFFGKPSAKETDQWGWRFEGHHVSLNFTFKGLDMVASTPQFLGSNPAEVKDGPHKGLRVLGQEEDLARELVRSLGAKQREAAVVSNRAPADLITSNQREASILRDEGLRYSDMDEKQKALLQKLVRSYADVQTNRQAKARMKKVEAEGWDNLKFAWMGGTEAGQGHYYRIQGKTFLIEYDNTQNGANHIHTVWRDFGGDFGKDVLAEHYESSAHHKH